MGGQAGLGTGSTNKQGGPCTATKAEGGLCGAESSHTWRGGVCQACYMRLWRAKKKKEAEEEAKMAAKAARFFKKHKTD